MLANHAKLMKFFLASEEVTGRKKLQKMIYILKKCEVPFEEKYEFHFYGPYSEELTLRIEELCNLGFISELKEKKSNYYQYRYQMTKQGEDFLHHSQVQLPPMEEKINLMKEKSSRFLELVSTMLYFDHLEPQEVEEKVRTVKKKQNYTDQDMAEAWVFISELRQKH
ncbi:YwgA family protein [Aquibacillus koreensis]|uniref:YwgA family protein n=1 Tax=Aquibacillus koreensis TaxID=279446 RepID=A0A9X4AI50_9BACI|nr:YwgA family protein [Aquibacillus koreensis]MCT2538270.1 YwgA family protein [Aquibacillus koreensis]MDC3420787.1 YwgA family protein [Aquibacillus koreensis]